MPGMKISLDAAMRARDVTQPTTADYDKAEEADAADARLALQPGRARPGAAARAIARSARPATGAATGPPAVPGGAVTGSSATGSPATGTAGAGGLATGREPAPARPQAQRPAPDDGQTPAKPARPTGRGRRRRSRLRPAGPEQAGDPPQAW